MDREKILQEAINCVCHDRQDAYGKPEDNFLAIAKLWNAYMDNKYGTIDIEPEDVGIMLALMKIGRMTSGKVKADNYIDAAGYLACAGEMDTQIYNCEEPIKPIGNEDYE